MALAKPEEEKKPKWRRLNGVEIASVLTALSQAKSCTLESPSPDHPPQSEKKARSVNIDEK
jgi:hypothetical protein